MFRHWDSRAFDVIYKCESIHYSPYDEFNEAQSNTLFFSVYGDLDPDLGIGAPELYIQVDFAITEPALETASLKVIGCRKKKKDEPYEKTEVINDLSGSRWTENSAEVK